MKILYATSEAVPFCKTGGLADVAGSLPSALAEQGAEIAVVLPLFALLGIGIPVLSSRAAQRYSVVERLRQE